MRLFLFGRRGEMMSKSRRGRPTKLTPEIQEKIVSVIRKGNYIETAAAYAGISKQTLYNWLRTGSRKPTGVYGEFVRAVEQALAESEMADLARIEQAAIEGHWQASAWRLERRFPKRWGKQDYHDIILAEQRSESATKSSYKLSFGRLNRD
jgi:transposase